MGGAPINFACHCGQLGARALPISCIGQDALGTEILKAIATLGMDARHISIDPARPTGTVEVSLTDGKPSYVICENVAWDHIPVFDGINELAANTDAVCFGSLGQRSAASRATVQSFLKSMHKDALKIFDINLRQHFHSDEIIFQSLELCNVLKLSDEELPTLARQFNLCGSIDEQLGALLQQFNVKLIAYTRGGDGSLLVSSDEMSDHPGNPGTVASTVGAGDSFTATLCIGLLKGMTLNDINHWANQVATYVVSQTGATPKLPKELINKKGINHAE